MTGSTHINERSGAPATPSPKPATLALQPDNIPVSLRERQQWVGWKLELRKGEWAKVPVNPTTGANASPTDPTTWSSFDAALRACRAWGLEGIGFVFTKGDPFAGIDLDDCTDEYGEIHPEARALIERFGSYAERSPSGEGAKIFIRGVKAINKCTRSGLFGSGKVEVYDEKRFFTLTGHILPGVPREVHEAQAVLDGVLSEIAGRDPPARSRAALAPARRFEPLADDHALIERAMHARNGAKFRALWEGDTSGYRGDDSAADLAFCNMLVNWTGGNPERTDRLFRQSKLLRPKWDEQRGEKTYGQLTVCCAMEGYCANGVGTRRIGTGGVVSDTDHGDDAVGLGERDPGTGRLILSPSRTLPTAIAYLHEFNELNGLRTLHACAGQLLEWRGNCYRPLDDEQVKKRLQPWLHGALRVSRAGRAGGPELVDFDSNPWTVGQALGTIRTHVILPEATVSPSWLDAEPGRPPADEILSCKTLNLHIPTGTVMPATPALFTVSALDFDFDASAPAPVKWLAFLREIFGDDEESPNLLQEWAGCCLTADTRQQKMLLVVGPKRAGKGTIARVMTRLVGAGNVVSPTVSSLAQNFGLQPLIGKSLAIVSDARFAGECLSVVAERLLCISGEDVLTVDRKYKDPVSLKLPTRFMFLTNELPRLNDASGALDSRFLVLRLTKSFYGVEDTELAARLLQELPGILGWALTGWRRLRERGRFLQPRSAADDVRDLADLASPVGAFVRARCEVGAGLRVPVDEMHDCWTAWCQQLGRPACDRHVFGRDLRAVEPGVIRRRSTARAFYDGIALKGAAA